MTAPLSSQGPEASQPSNARRSFLFFLGIFGFLWFWKIRASLSPFNLGIDGSFYTDIAMHVRDGRGLFTDVSLYHKGFTTFPHKSSIYPVWPLVYGWLSRFIHWRLVAIWVPTIGYFATLLFAYLWGRKLTARDLFPTLLRGFGLGHLTVLIFGLHTEFFEFTTRPYTEGLAYAFVMLALWRSVPILRAPDLRGGLELGLWMTLAFMTRSQLFLAVIAFVLVMLWMVCVAARRRAVVACLLGALAVFSGAALWQYAYCRDAFAEWPFLALKFHNARESGVLSHVEMVIPFASLQERALDVLSGFAVAFAWEGKYAYSRSFHLFQYAALAVLPWLLWDLVRSLRDSAARSRALTWLRSPESAPWIFVALLSLGGFLSIYLFHKQYFAPWNFARRHGVIAGLFFALCFYRLCRDASALRGALALAILVASAYLGTMHGIRPMVHNLEGPYVRQEVPYPDLVNWLQRKADEENGITVALVAHRPQEIAPFTDNIGYHWIYELTTPQDVLKIFRKLDADFLIVPKWSEKWMYRDIAGGMKKHFKKVRTLAACEIYEYRERR